MGSLAATARASRPKCHHQNPPNRHRCLDTEPTPKSCDMTLSSGNPCARIEHMFESLDVLVTQLRASAPPSPDLNTAVWPPVLDPDSSVVDQIVELERAKAMIEARVMVLVAELSDRAEGWVDDEGRKFDERLSAETLAAAELAPALHLAPVTAGIRVDRAVRLRDRLPATLRAMAHGRLDIGRVLAIDEATRPLTDGAAARVERMVLGKAVNQTAGELRASLRRAVIAVDPNGAEERRKVAVKGRRVVRYQRDDGTSALEAVLSAIDTGEIYDVVDEIARRSKTTGDTRTMDARRADALVRLVLGRDPQLGPEDSDPPTDGPGPSDTPPPDPPRDEDPNDGATDDDLPAHREPAHDVPGNDERLHAGPDDDVPGGEHEPGKDASDDDLSDGYVLGVDGIGDARAEEASAEDARADEAGWSQWPDAIELAQRDAELNRIDQARDARTARINELASLALSAMTTRQIGRARWVTINPFLRPDGTTVSVGELEGYGPITADEAAHLLASGVARSPDPPSGREPTAAQAARHDPPDWLDRETRLRDGTCRYPGCRVSAQRGDLDHTVPHPRGKTVRDNLGGLCRRHHLVKHSGTWRVSQDSASRYTWTSMITGRTSTTNPRGTNGDWTGAKTTKPLVVQHPAVATIKSEVRHVRLGGLLHPARQVVQSGPEGAGRRPRTVAADAPGERTATASCQGCRAS